MIYDDTGEFIEDFFESFLIIDIKLDWKHQ